MDKSIVFASRTLSAAERNYSQIEREVVGIVFGVITDHRPLTKIYGPKTGIPSMAAARMQRWEYQYDIQYIPLKVNANADMLSRLPGDTPESASSDKIESVCMLTINELPVTALQIAESTRKDTTLIKIYDYPLRGWPKSCSRFDELYPFFVRKEEHSLEYGCILWVRRVVIPLTYTEQLLHELYAMHPGMVRMKAIARSFVCWLGIDNDIKEMVRSCPECSRHRNAPTASPLMPWPWATRP